MANKGERRNKDHKAERKKKGDTKTNGNQNNKAKTGVTEKTRRNKWKQG